MINRVFFVLLAICSCIDAIAQQRPKFFLVGDSISIYYTPYLQTDLSGTYEFSRKTSQAPESIAKQLSDPNVQGGNSSMVLEYLSKRYEDPAFRPDIVAINCGLHDIKRIPQTNAIAISPADYRSNLEKILQLVRSHHGKLIWISSTPVDDQRHNTLSKEFYRYDRDVVEYNGIARDFFTRSEVSIIDLYQFTKPFAPGHYIDHVHWDESTRMQQAAYIAGSVITLHNFHLLP